MQEFPSRSEKRLIKLYSAAKRGLKSLNDELLYGSEIKRYKKQGFDVSHTSSSLKNLNHSNVDWSNAFKNGVPYQVYSYICGETSAYPRVYVHNLAQELYVISEYTINHRKSY